MSLSLKTAAALVLVVARLVSVDACEHGNAKRNTTQRTARRNVAQR